MLRGWNCRRAAWNHLRRNKTEEVNDRLTRSCHGEQLGFKCLEGPVQESKGGTSERRLFGGMDGEDDMISLAKRQIFIY